MIKRTPEELTEIRENLRDSYAMAALSGITSNPNINPIMAASTFSSDLIAATAFHLADCMLELRDRDTLNVMQYVDDLPDKRSLLDCYRTSFDGIKR